MNLDSSAFHAAPELVRALEKQATSIFCPEDSILFRQGEASAGLYIIDRGSATLTMHLEQDEPILSLKVGEGSLLGLPGLISNEALTLTATAHKDSHVSFITREDFMALMRSDPLLSVKVLEVLAAEVRTARYAIINR